MANNDLTDIERISLVIEDLKSRDVLNFKALQNALHSFGINDFCAWSEVIPLDKVIGLDERKHNDGIYPYGVSSVSLRGGGFDISYHLGDISVEHFYLAKEKYQLCEKYGTLRKHDKMATDEIERGVYQFFLDKLEKRKEQLQNNLYYIDHFDEFQQKCLEIAQNYYKSRKGNYEVKLQVGNSLADTRVAPAIVIYKDGGQWSYIKILQDHFGDITLDACAIGCCHTHSTIKNFNKLNEIVTDYCEWLS